MTPGARADASKIASAGDHSAAKEPPPQVAGGAARALQFVVPVASEVTPGGARLATPAAAAAQPAVVALPVSAAPQALHLVTSSHTAGGLGSEGSKDGTQTEHKEVQKEMTGGKKEGEAAASADRVKDKAAAAPAAVVAASPEAAPP